MAIHVDLENNLYLAKTSQQTNLISKRKNSWLKNEKAVASVLAFEKKLVPSDGYLYGTSWEKRTEQKALKSNRKISARDNFKSLKPAVARSMH